MAAGFAEIVTTDNTPPMTVRSGPDRSGLATPRSASESVIASFGPSAATRRARPCRWSTGPVGDEQVILEAAREAGYRGVQGADAQRCHELGLMPIAYDIVQTTGRIRDLARRWADAGFVCATVMLGTGVESDDSAARLVEEVLAASSATGFPLYVETHRASVTQDIWRTLKLVECFPELRFTGDLGHWYTAHDLATWDFPGKLALIDPVLQRVRYLQGRIGTSGCFQVDVGDGGVDGRPHVAHFRSMWTRVAECFLASAADDPIPVIGLQLGFAPELLPAEFGFARQVRGSDGSLTEECDRWTQALVLGDIAADCFAHALAKSRSDAL